MDFDFGGNIDDKPPTKKKPMPGDIFTSNPSLTVLNVKRSARERLEERVVPIIAVAIFCFISSIGIPSVVALQGAGKLEQLPPVKQAASRVPVGDELRVPTSESAPLNLEVSDLSRQQLIGAILDSRVELSRAHEALSRARTERIPYLFEACILALRNADSAFEGELLECVSATGDKRAVPHIADLLHSQQPATRLKALEVLEKLGGNKVSHLLELRKLTETDTAVRQALVKSLQRIQPIGE